jgi:hypothetical protein
MKHLPNLLKILVLTVLLAFINSPFVLADVLVPGQSPVEYCFQIINVNKYPNYLFVASIGVPWKHDSRDNRIIRQRKCLGLEYVQEADIFAIKKSQVKSNDIITDKEGEKLKSLNSHKFTLIPTTKKIHNLRTLPSEYGVKKVVDSLEIVAIQPKSLDLRFKEVVFTFNQGKSETKAYQTQDKRPLPSLKQSFNLLNLTIPGFSIIGAILVYRNSKNLRNRNLS